MDYVCVKNGINLKSADGVKKLRHEMHKLEGREQAAYNDVLLDNLNWASWEMYLVLLNAVVEYYLTHILEKTPELFFEELNEFIKEHEEVVIALAHLRDAILHPYEIDFQLEEFGKAIDVSQVNPYRFAQSLHGHVRGLFYFLVGVERSLAISQGSHVDGR